MKKLLTLFSLLLLFVEMTAQAPNYEWATRFIGDSDIAGDDIVFDNSGNIYTVGTFEDTMVTDPWVGNLNFVALAPSSVGIYIIKQDVNGSIIWAKKIDGAGLYYYTKTVSDIKLAEGGYLYVAGEFWGDIDLDPGPGQAMFSTGPQEKGSYICKLDMNGDFVWGNAIIGPDLFSQNRITVDNVGAVYATGSFYGDSLDFNPGAGVYHLYGRGAYVYKLDSNGDFVWAKQFAGGGGGFHLGTDANNDVYVAGIFQDSVDFDPGLLVYLLPGQAGDDNLFVAKLSSFGDFIWAKQVLSNNDDFFLNSMAIDDAGHVFVSGDFETLIDFDPGAAVNNLDPISGGKYLLKLDAAGDFVWLRQFDAYNAKIALDDIGNVYAFGQYSGSVDFDPGAGVVILNSTTLSYMREGYLLKLDPAGDFVWVGQLATFGSFYPNAINLSRSGTIGLTGSFCHTIDFDPSTNVANLNPSSDYEGFVTTYSSCKIQTIDSIVACVSYTWIDGNTYTSSNNTANYVVSGGATNGCDSVVLLNLAINTVDTSTVINGLTITSNASNATYQWLDCNNNLSPVFGASSQGFTPTTNGSYAVQVIQNGCIDTSACVSINSVGIINNDLGQSFNIYPNPTDGKIILDFEKIQEDLSISLYTLAGQLIQSTQFVYSNKIELTIEQPAGLFLLEVKDKFGKKAVMKIVKK